MTKRYGTADAHLTQLSDDSIEEQIRRFEEAWQSGSEPDLASFAQAADPRLTIELVHTDLEYRLKLGHPARVERYFDDFPWIAADPVLALELIAAEFRFRSRTDAELSTAEYEERFPQWRDLLADQLTPSIQNSGGPERVTQTASDTSRPASPASGNMQDDSQTTPMHSPPVHSSSAPSSAIVSGRLPEIPGYEMCRLVAAGGMGVVYEAVDHTLRRRVAIKLPRTQLLAGTDDQQRFLREARSAARLSHPHICPIYEVGEYQGQPYLAMAFIDGLTLRQWAQQSTPTPHEAARVVATLAETVHYAHEHGVIHRDIKPANVMIDSESGRPILMDFGLAKELSENDSQVTRSGQVMGTPAYMAPEQAAGAIDEIGPRSDVYALGAVLFELISGRVPFIGNVGEVLQQVQTEDPPSLRRLARQAHRDLDTICGKAIARRPADRYATAQDLAADLRRFCDGEAILARRMNPIERLWRRAKRSPWATAAALLLVAILVSAAVLGPRLRDTLRAAELSRQVQAQLDQEAWKVSDSAEIEPLIAQLRVYDPQGADLATASLARRLGDFASAQLQMSRLDAETEESIELALSQLEPLDAQRSAQLRSAWQRRQRVWQEVIDLNAPFDPDEVRQSFPQHALKIEPGGLWHEQRSSEVLSNVLSRDDVRLEVEFAGGWTEARQIGLLLNARSGHRNGVIKVAWGADNTWAASLDTVGMLKFWDLASVSELEPPVSGVEDVRTFALSHDNRLIAIVRNTGPTVEIWDREQKKLLHALEIAVPSISPQIDFSPDGSLLACLFGNFYTPGSLQVVDVAQGTVVQTCPAFEKFGESLQFSLDGTRLAAGDLQGTLVVWDTNDWQELHREKHHDGGLYDLCWIPPQGQRLATASSDGLIKIWDAGTFRLLHSFQAFAAGSYCLDVTPDGRTLTAGYDNHCVKVWDLATQRIRCTLLNTTGRVDSLDMSPDGRHLICDDADRIRLWDIVAQREQVVMGSERYAMLLSSLPPPYRSLDLIPTLQSRNDEGLPLSLQILRSGTPLRIEQRTAPGETLHMVATREGQHVSVQINDAPVLHFHDALAIDARFPGVLGLQWPAGVRVKTIKAFRKAAAEQSSPLERGDQLYAQGKFDEALVQYESQLQQLPVNDDMAAFGLEARYKAGLCLQNLNRTEQAVEHFQAVSETAVLAMTDPAQRSWQMLSAAQLWLLYVVENQYAQAESFLHELRAQNSLQEIARYVPHHTRQQLFDAHVQAGEAAEVRGDVISQLQMAVEVGELFGADEIRLREVKFELAQAFADAGLLDQANDTSAALLNEIEFNSPGALANSTLRTAMPVLMLRVSVLRMQQEFQTAGNLLDHWLYSTPGEFREGHEELGFNLLLEHARVCLADNRLNEAQRYLDQFQQLNEGRTLRYRTHATHCLLQGIVVLEQVGAMPDAEVLQKVQDCFARGTYAAWLPDAPVGTPELCATLDRGAIENMVLVSLCDDVTDEQLHQLSRTIDAVVPHNPLAKLVTSQHLVSPDRMQQILRQMWRSPRGLTKARQIAIGLNSQQALNTFFETAAAEAIHQSASIPTANEAETEIVWMTVQQLLNSYHSGDFNPTHAIRLAAAWKGRMQFPGWNSVASELPVQMRGPLAYVLARRFENVLDQKEEARVLFETAQADAPANSVLATTAAQRLAELSGGN